MIKRGLHQFKPWIQPFLSVLLQGILQDTQKRPDKCIKFKFKYHLNTFYKCIFFLILAKARKWGKKTSDINYIKIMMSLLSCRKCLGYPIFQLPSTAFCLLKFLVTNIARLIKGLILLESDNQRFFLIAPKFCLPSKGQPKLFLAKLTSRISYPPRLLQ